MIIEANWDGRSGKCYVINAYEIQGII